MKNWLIIACSIAVLAACTPAEHVDDDHALFTLVPPEESGVEFINNVENTEDLNIFNYRNFYNGGGVATGDINNDGLTDIFLTHNTDKNRLFVNRGNFRFEDITETAGVGGNRTWSTGVVMVDIDADGWLDIYVCNAGYVEGEDQQNELYINNQDGTFTERAADYGLNEGGYTTHAAFFDYDLDGDLDAYILNNSFMPVNTLNYSNKRELRAQDWPVKDFLKGGGDKLLRNDDGQFIDVTELAGIYSSLIGFGLGITIGDVNGDYWPDMYVSNDFFERDYLYINQGNGTFREDIKQWMEHLSLFSMGADMADINNDGYPEIFVTDMLPDDDERLKRTTSFETYSVYDLKQKRDFYHQYMQNTLQLNNRDNTFSEIAHFSGVSASDWSWGALMFDMDNDGFRDIYVCNGIAKDVTDQDFIDFFANEVIQQMALTGEKEDMQNILERMPSTPVANKAFRNLGNLRFNDVTEQWGFDNPSFSNGASYADLDNDGDLDLVVNNLKENAFVFRNTSEKSGNTSITVSLTGTGQNTYAVGARVAVHAGEEVLSGEVIPSRGFQSSADYKVLIGLGDRKRIDSIVVYWPDRTKSVLTGTPPGSKLEISYDSSSHEPVEKSRDEETHRKTLLTAADIVLPSHQENDYADFYYEGLLMKKLSAEGPAVAIGDINGDDQDDVFIGGAKGFPARVYIQQNGQLLESNSRAITAHLEFEDTAASFFDADGDGDEDLYVGSGGSEYPKGSGNLLDRLYLNDGSGKFTLSASAIPANSQNTSVVLPLDIDGDDDMDLFVCSRNLTNNYGVAPPHHVYQNDGRGTFTDISSSLSEVLEALGLVTDACLADVTGDAVPEIIVTAEWSAPVVLEVHNGQLQIRQTSLEEYPGWWYAVEAADLDDDGDQDLVLGNLGDNFYLEASSESPVKLWLSDFDKNATVENIMTRTVDGRDVPVPMKKELTEQLASLKKENIKHADYSQRSIEELFTKDQLADATVRSVTHSSSSVAWNEGNGSFTLEELAPEVQFSCTCDILCTDVDGNGRTDILLGGNDYGFLPQFSRQDASFGHTLLNEGGRNLRRVSNNESGFFVRGQIREIVPVTLDGQPHVMVALNNDEPKFFRLNDK